MSFLNTSEEPFGYELKPLAGGSYEVLVYEDGKYISRRYFTNVADASDWGTNYCWGLNNGD